MNCREVEEYMQRYLDHDLDPEETAQLYRHVAVCPACAETFRMLKALSRDLEDLPAVTPPISLVDSILPQLDAIDLARNERLAEAAQKPAEMIPEPRRSSRKASWWSSIAGRTVIGSAAAAIILGVAIFNYEPKMLSEVEVPYAQDEASMKSGSGNTDNSRELVSTEMPDEAAPSSELKGPDAGSQDAPPPEESAPDAMTETVDPDEPVSSGPVQAPSVDGETADVPPAKSRTGEEPSKGGESPADQGSPKGSSNDTSNKVVPPKTVEPGSQEEGAAADYKKDAADSKGSVPEEPPVEEPMMEKAEKYGFTSMAAPKQWNSPDGLYGVLLETDKLVVYRYSASGGTGPETLETIPVKGELVSGQWSEDSKSFTYTTMTDQKEVTHVYAPQKPSGKDQPQEQVAPTDQAGQQTNQTNPEGSVEKTEEPAAEAKP
ncbi:anti-sigma factor family protein [Paenibacillus sp. DMB20]|uniref:anti-sigma factor family protein n=1 Tax=Paenibacillus sp. DMB20 TaxID=1642570 RepID=UPI0006993B49|nr:anti-sigma factor [Paenibacillus sp. DMB20]